MTKNKDKGKMVLNRKNITRVWNLGQLMNRLVDLEQRIEELEGQFKPISVSIESSVDASGLDGVLCDCQREDAHTVGQHLDEHDKALQTVVPLGELLN